MRCTQATRHHTLSIRTSILKKDACLKVVGRTLNPLVTEHLAGTRLVKVR